MQGLTGYGNIARTLIRALGSKGAPPTPAGLNTQVQMIADPPGKPAPDNPTAPETTGCPLAREIPNPVREVAT